MEILRADVLIIGGDGAGMQAALAARANGARVILLSKTPLGKSTCTYLSGGAFAVAAEGFTKADHRRNIFNTGRGINAADLVNILVEETPTRIKELVDQGLSGTWLKG